MTKLFLSFFLLFALVCSNIPLHAADKHVSDDLIYDNVKEKLAIDPDVKGGAFDIEVKDGNVTLKGKVDSEKRKDKAARLAKRIRGVKSVDNQLQVVLK
jgi:hyperosmotically inducible periplasmic protein